MNNIRTAVALLLAVTFGAALATEAAFLPAGNEITKLRDEFSRHYSNGDSSYTAIIAAMPISERSGDGWLPNDAEYTVGTDSLPYSTGTCTRDDVNDLYGKSDNTVKVEHIIGAGIPPAETTRCGWFKFRTTSIPDSATILRARIRYLVHYWEFSFDFRFTAVNVDPVSTGARDLFFAIENGAICADVPMGRLWDTIELNVTGTSHIKNTLGQNWVAFGLWGYDWSHVLTEKAWIIGWNTSPRSDSPWLDINYSLTGSTEKVEPALSWPRMEIVPNPAKGAFVTVHIWFVRCSPVGTQRSLLRVFDTAGCCVLARHLAINHDNLVIPLDIGELSAGIYIVRLDTDRMTAVQKLVVQQ
ncbi:MAG: T9SS type A sorting domain-containing protein [candidate division WOR-3 bacterium]